MCSRARVLMQSSYEDTVENGAREEKKRYSRVQPKKKEKRKYLRHLVHFFLFFRGKKGKTHPFLDRSRDASFFLFCCVVLVFVVCDENERKTKKETLHDTIVVSHNRGTHLRATPSASEASDDDDNDEEQEDDDDDDEEDNAFSSSRVSSVFLFRDHFRVWRRTTITIPTTTETRITER